VTAQRAENNQKNYKKDNFYIISIEIVFFHLSRYFMSQPLFYDQRCSTLPNFQIRVDIKHVIKNKATKK
ncbi:hypothetical protein RJB44_10495, partial [Staphylococcus hominis]|nr:hypothetical protein [Staphylococcus hominis]